MNYNDVLRSVRFALDLPETRVVELLALAGHAADRAAVVTYLKKEDEAGYVECDAALLDHFLDGLIIERRGPRDDGALLHAPSQLSNNHILKKLRIAFELKEDDVLAILHSVQFRITKSELNALFRAPGHKNYRPCGDQFMRNFLRGLALRYRR